MEKNYYTYLIKYPNFKLYHGSRGCTGAIADDASYMGSSKYTPKEGGVKQILTTHSTREEALAEEIRYHALHNVKDNPLFHNKSNQTSTGFSIAGTSRSLETRKKISDSHKGKKVSLETRAKQRAAKLGKKLSPETCARMSASRRGEKSPMFGKDVSAATREKMSLAALGKKLSDITRERISVAKTGEKNSSYNTTQYSWVHKTGTEEFMTSYDLGVKYEISSELLRRVARGDRVTHKGWRLAKPLDNK